MDVVKLGCFSRLCSELRNTAGRLSSRVVKMSRRYLRDIINEKQALLNEAQSLKRSDMTNLQLCYELAGEYDNAARLIKHLNSKN